MARAPDGRVVFVEGAAPDERVEAEILQDNLRFARARVVRVLSPGPGRVEPACPRYGRCGGCSLMHLAPPAQLAAKAQALEDSLLRLGRLSLAEVTIEPPAAVPERGYRQRTRLHVDRSGAAGFRGRDSSQVVPAEGCLVLSAPLERALQAVAQAARAAAPLAHEVEVHAVASGEEVLLALDPAPPALCAALSRVLPPGLRLAGPGEALPSQDGQGPLLLAPRVFAQAGAAGNLLCLETIARWISPVPLAMELYSGSGNLSRVLAARAGRLLAFEADAAAVELARRVAPPNVQVERLSALAALRAWSGPPPALVCVDPPRAGLEREVLAELLRLGPAAVLYLSCDPATFARDAGRLGEGGLALARLRLFDLYPHTAHAEVLGLFFRAGHVEAGPGRSSQG